MDAPLGSNGTHTPRMANDAAKAPPAVVAGAPLQSEPKRGATFSSQARALYRKNAVYQRRNWCSNACLLAAPIFFCLLLFIVQIAVNKLLLTGENFEVRACAAVLLLCGHQLLRCPCLRIATHHLQEGLSRITSPSV